MKLFNIIVIISWIIGIILLFTAPEWSYLGLCLPAGAAAGTAAAQLTT